MKSKKNALVINNKLPVASSKLASSNYRACTLAPMRDNLASKELVLPSFTFA